MTRERTAGLRCGAAICALTLLFTPLCALGQAKAGDTEGVIVAIDQGDLVVDLGSTRGASAGDVVEVWRPLRLRHPVTGKALTDRFLIGTLKLSQVRPTLSTARPEGDLARPAASGDIVVLRRNAVAASPVAPSGSTAAVPPSPASGGAETDPEAQELSAVFEGLRGADPAARIKRYEEFARAKPKGRFAVVLWEEAQSLRHLFDASHPVPPPSGLRSRSFAPPSRILAGTPMELVIEIEGAASGAVAHVRGDGEVAYTPLAMRAVGDGYWAVSLPSSRVTAPGLDLFVEATNAKGEAVEIAGTGKSPKHVDVTDLPRVTPPVRMRVSATLASEVAYWSSPSKNNDRVFQTEGAFGVRFGDEGIRAVRSGFGVYRGVGGTLHELDDLHLAPRSVGLTYGYLEAEWGFAPSWSFVGRVVVGLRDGGTGGGGQGFIRIGSDLGTNLLLGGEVLGGIGVRGITQLTWASIPRVPIVLRTEVTNQPAGAATADNPTSTLSTGQGEVGARAVAQVGYRFLPELTVSVRGSYQGRTINHAGPGFGAEVSTSW